jgi:serine/threonine protein phosphatase PrpC
MFEVYSYTDKGLIREKNEDSLLVLSLDHKILIQGESEKFSSIRLEPPFLCVLSDGMGGHGSGDVASGIVVQKFSEILPDLNQSNDPILYLKNQFQKINYAINDQDDRFSIKMGATVVGIYFKSPKEIYYFHAGDSRAYQMDSEHLVSLTIDHNYGNLMNWQDGQNDPRYYSLVNCVGAGSDDNYLEFSKPDNIDPDCMYILSSDGVHEYIDMDKFKNYLPNLNEENMFKRLKDDIYHEKNAPDNLSLIVIRKSKDESNHLFPQ